MPRKLRSTRAVQSVLAEEASRNDEEMLSIPRATSQQEPTGEENLPTVGAITNAQPSRVRKNLGTPPGPSGLGTKPRTVRLSLEQSALLSSGASSVQSRKRKLELQAAEERAKIRRKTLEEKERLELELVDNRLAVDLAEIDEQSQIDDQSSRAASPQGNFQRVEEWVNNSVHERQRQKDRNTPASRERNVDVVSPGLVARQERAEQPQGADYAGPHGGPRVEMADAHFANNDVTRLSQAITRTLEAVQSGAPAGMTSRVLNRLTIRELPVFNGDCLEWLKFKRVFNLSTEIGGYSDAENITRLYGSLRGEAKEAVASLMMGTTSIQEIMDTLELRFGNPDVIFRKISQDIKKLPSVESGRISIVTLATKIRNCVAGLQAVGENGYLHSPELASEIIKKMSPAMVPHYNRFQSNAPANEPRLVTMSQFLFKEAEMACKAGTNLPENTRRSPLGYAEKADIRHRTNPTHTHGFKTRPLAVYNTSVAANPGSATRNQRGTSRPIVAQSRKCDYCRVRSHSIDDCRVFLALAVSQRVEWAKKMNVCFCCLEKGHRYAKCCVSNGSHGGHRQRRHALLSEEPQPSTSAQSQAS